MTFAETAALKAAWLIPLALVLLWWAYAQRKKRLLAFFGQTAQAWISVWRTAVKGWLFLLALLFLILGIAGPRWDFEWQEIKRGGVDIMVVLDVSRSMLAEDVSPNRLERAKREVIDLLGRAQGDRLGLVAFAGTAFVQCPLTSDYGALKIFLDHLDTELIPTQGTDIGFALQVAAEGLAQGGPEESTGQAILLMTDGEDLEGVGLTQAKMLAEKGIKIFTMSIGTKDGGPIPIPGGGYKKDRQGNLVITRPDMGALKTMALSGGGSFVSSVATDADLRYIYDQGIKKALEDREYETTRKRLWYERFQWFLLAAFLTLVLEFLIRDGKPKAVRASALVLALVFIGASDPGVAASTGATGQQEFEQGRFDKASDLFLEAEIEEPESAQHTYNKGVANYKAGEFEAAAKAFEQAAGKAEGPLKERSLFNLGNARAMGGDLKNAVKAYEETLKLKTDHKEAAENLQFVKKLIEQQPPPEQNQQSDQNDEQNQDQQQQGEQPQDSQQSQDKNQEQQGEKTAENKTEQGQADPDTEQKPDEGEQGQSDEEQQTQADQQQQAEKKQQQDAEKQAGEQEKEHGEQEEQGGEEESAAQTADARNASDREIQETPQEMTKEEAERVLRSIQNYSQRYLYRPPGKRGAARPQKDW